MIPPPVLELLELPTEIVSSFLALTFSPIATARSPAAVDNLPTATAPVPVVNC